LTDNMVEEEEAEALLALGDLPDDTGLKLGPTLGLAVGAEPVELERDISDLGTARLAST
jgi:hypothetical protein